MMFRGPFGAGGELDQTQGGQSGSGDRSGRQPDEYCRGHRPGGRPEGRSRRHPEAGCSVGQRGGREGLPPGICGLHRYGRAHQRGLRSKPNALRLGLHPVQALSRTNGQLLPGRSRRIRGAARRPKHPEHRRFGYRGGGLGGHAHKLGRGQRSAGYADGHRHRLSKSWMRTRRQSDASSSTRSRTPAPRTS